MSELTLPVMKIKCDMEGSSRSNLSYQHMQDAIHLAKMSKNCEIDNRGKQVSDGDFWNHHRAYVVGSIMISIACVEAKINEFYATAFDRYSHLKSIHPDQNIRDEFIESWEILFQNRDKERFEEIRDDILQAFKKPRNEILKKYQVALSATECNKFDTSSSPYQDVQLLINLRNMLTHFTPEWDDALDRHKKIEDQLRGKFELNPFFPENGAPFFPFMCLSYSCANWAVQSCMDFIFEFFRLTEMDTRSDSYTIWERLRESLKHVQER